MKNRMMRMPEKGRFVEVQEEMPEASGSTVVVRIEYCGNLWFGYAFLPERGHRHQKSAAEFYSGA